MAEETLTPAMVFEDSQTRVVRLRVRSYGLDPQVARLRVTNLLNTAALQPDGLGPSAVLIVRRMADPLPGRLAPHRRPARIDAAWERAARDVLSMLYRRAARPSKGYVPASAEAVLFADEGEMLACLALDVARGEARGRWWWQAILTGVPAPLPAGLTRLLCQRATSVPAALHHLSEWGQAARVLDALSVDQARAILGAVTCAFDVPGLRLGPTFLSGHSTVDRFAVGGERSATWGNDAEVLLPVEPPGGRRGGGVARPSPSPWGTELVLPGLEKTRACLLGVSLSLYRRPAMVRSEVFLRALVAWWEAPTLSGLESKPAAGRRDALGEEFPLPTDRGVAAPDASEGTLSQLGAGEVSLPGFPPLEARGVQSKPAGRWQVERAPQQRPAERNVGETERSTVAESRPIGTGAGQMGVDGAHPVHGYTASHGSEESAETGERPAMASVGFEQDEKPSKLVGQLEREKSNVLVAEASVGLESGLYTELGGVLYLINLMAYLDLPTCFEADWGLESRIGSWGVLELLGRGLLAWENVGCEEDSLWAALARLDGREPGELPGVTFVGGERFRLPVEWFVGLGGEEKGVYRYAARRGWLRLWTEAGHVLADVPRDGVPPKTQAAAELRRYLGVTAPALTHAAFDRAPLTRLDGPLVAGLNAHLVRWLALVLPAVRLRLRRGLNPPGGEAWNLADALLLCPGRLYVTSTHVDLVMRLDSISLSLRLAGLDRNPGWMADMGRVVSFHFE
jgi:hypothetical protein